MLRFRFQNPPLITEERNMLVTVHYRPDLTETQWHLIKKGIPPQKKGLNKSADDASSIPSTREFEAWCGKELCMPLPEFVMPSK